MIFYCFMRPDGFIFNEGVEAFSEYNGSFYGANEADRVHGLYSGRFKRLKVQRVPIEIEYLPECGYCKKQKPVQERYSAGVYAGKMCDDCAYSRYRDHCGTPQLTQADLDETIEPEDYY